MLHLTLECTAFVYALVFDEPCIPTTNGEKFKWYDFEELIAIHHCFPCQNFAPFL